MARVCPDARPARITPPTPTAPTTKPATRALHEVNVRGIVAECATDGCAWMGTADEAVGHIFRGQ